MRARTGFTIIELMVVVAVIAILSAIAIPNLVSARVTANETAAASVLRTISSAQAQVQAGSEIDVDGDGAGEYGYFRELSGGFGLRTVADGSATGAVLAPAVLSGSFRGLSANGTVSRSGYMFRITLPTATGVAVNETPSAALTGSVDADLAETTWCALAWPASFRTSGNRSFFVNQRGEIVTTVEPAYSGESPGYLSGAAFQGPGNLSSLTGKLAVGTYGRDGNLWKQLN